MIGWITVLIAIASAIGVAVITAMAKVKLDRAKQAHSDQPNSSATGDNDQLTMLKMSVHRRACVGLIIAASTAILNSAMLLWLMPASHELSGWQIFLWSFNIGIFLPQAFVFLWLDILRRAYRPSLLTPVPPA